MAKLDGILLVDKPEGHSSAQVVRELKKALRVDKIGHLGTLDPFASGLLPVCINAATKLSAYLMAEGKTYHGTLRLGIETDTLDRTGTVTRRLPIPDVDVATLKDVAQRYTGEILQTPPMYSALKRDGVPLYKLARRGIRVERSPRRVKIFCLALEVETAQTLRFSVSCSKGTYVRALAADVGAALNSVAHLTCLRRTAFGPFALEHAVSLDTARRPTVLPLLSLETATGSYRTFSVSGPSATRLRRGQQAELQTLPAARERAEIARVLGPDGGLVALLKADPVCWKLARVF